MISYLNLPRSHWVYSVTNSKFAKHVTFLNILTLVWIAAVYWGERHVFWSHIRSCDWSNWEAWVSLLCDML
jgi:hypothetical protein